MPCGKVLLVPWNQFREEMTSWICEGSHVRLSNGSMSETAFSFYLCKFHLNLQGCHGMYKASPASNSTWQTSVGGCQCLAKWTNVEAYTMYPEAPFHPGKRTSSGVSKSTMLLTWIFQWRFKNGESERWSRAMISMPQIRPAVQVVVNWKWIQMLPILPHGH